MISPVVVVSAKPYLISAFVLGFIAVIAARGSDWFVALVLGVPAIMAGIVAARIITLKIGAALWH